MERVFMVYKTDNQHSFASRDVIAIASGLTHAIFLVIEKSEKEDFTIKQGSDQYYNLCNLKQTQGYEGEGEFQIEPIETDILI
jgi:hypothetical protein